MGAWDLWEAALIPSLLANCGTWTELPSKAVEELEDMQNLFIRMMLQVPVSTPKAALRGETGILGMRHRIWLEKVKLAQFLRQSGTSTLAGAVYHEQVVQGWPGLAMEVEDICKTLEISNLEITKSDIKNAISKHHAEELRGQMCKKLKDIMNEDKPICYSVQLDFWLHI